MSGSPIVSTEWLSANLERPDIRIIDIRGHVLPASDPPPHYFSHLAEYNVSHIPGAVFVDWNNDIVDPGTISGNVAKPESYAALMSRLGVDEDVSVVAYDDANGMFAARMWWTLQYYGHPKAAVLDGGWDKWVREGREVTAIVPEIPSRNFVPRVRHELRASTDDVLQADLLIDVRTEAEFYGESSRARRSGRIPGAVNLPRSELLQSDGVLRSIPELVEIFTALGIGNDRVSPILYCNAGVSASYGLLALHAAGFVDGRVYDDSWKVWGNDEHLPIEK